MAENSDVQTRGCLVWMTERPRVDVQRESSNFWLLGYEWKFNLTLCLLSDSYKIILRKVSNKYRLQDYLTVTTFIRVASRESCLCNVSSSFDAEQNVCCFSMKSVDKALGSDLHQGKWTIVFVFRSACPLTLHVPGSEGQQRSTSEDETKFLQRFTRGRGRGSRCHLTRELLYPPKVILENQGSRPVTTPGGEGTFRTTHEICDTSPLFPDPGDTAAKRESKLTVTDPHLKTALDSNKVSKGILHADKGVQACFDIPPDLESLSSDFCKLLESQTFADVKLRCGDRTISAHRSILAARSDVFTAMFRNKMAESKTGTVDVTDMDSDVLGLLLQYLYSGKITDLSEDTASSLYEAGDKYSIRALQKSCSDWMVGNLTVENCLGCLVVADAHSDEEFKGRVVDFVAENLKSIKKDAWSKFNKDHAWLANSVYQRLFAPTLDEQA